MNAQDIMDKIIQYRDDAHDAAVVMYESKNHEKYFTWRQVEDVLSDLIYDIENG
jgi:hypothetical protein